MPTSNTFRTIFGLLMGFVAFVWIWAVGMIMAWPVEKTSKWEPEFRLVAVCSNGDPCSIPYGKLAEEKASGRIKSLIPLEPVGEFQEADAWLRWKTETGKAWKYEAKRSNWDFESTIRYRFDGETPVLVEVLRYDTGLLMYAIPMSLVTVAGMFLRSFRR